MNIIRALSVITIIGVALTVLGCATYTTHYDYDPQVRFVELKNYDWLEPVNKGQVLNELTVKRIITAVDNQLAGKGYSMDSGNPDFLVAIHGGTEKKVDVVDWGYSYRGFENYRYSTYSRNRRIDVYEYEEGTLIIDFVDGDTRELIWRGSVTKVIDPKANPEKREKVINEAVAKALENFPPPVN